METTKTIIVKKFFNSITFLDSISFPYPLQLSLYLKDKNRKNLESNVPY